jgi:hypothetical protein
MKIVNAQHSLKNSEKTRAGASVIVGFKDEKSLKQIIAHYQINEDDAKYWWEYFGFSGSSVEKKTKTRKKNHIFEFLKENAGSEITVKDLCDKCSISQPTAYKFVNDNIGWFKKVKRGLYLIVDADEERKKAKSNG